MNRILAPLLVGLLVLGPLPALADPFVEFAGHQWLVRSYGGGPGPNEWREDNVFVDAEGLHLTIRQVDGVWTCAEVVMMGEPLGFGTYQFDVASDLALLDRNAVLGLFNYPGSPEIGPDGTNEIDIEIAQWGDANNPNRLNWNIYPAREGGRKGNHALPLPKGAVPSMHRFTWTAGGIDYVSSHGMGETAPIGEWTYAPKKASRDIPQAPLVVHMNLWLNGGKAPADGQPVEIVISGFSFTPAAAP